MNARTERPLTEAELLELRQQHAMMGCTFKGIPFDYVMADRVLRGCLMNTLEANKKRVAAFKARMAREAAEFALTP